jgi:hypothetical protein
MTAEYNKLTCIAEPLWRSDPVPVGSIPFSIVLDGSKESNRNIKILKSQLLSSLCYLPVTMVLSRFNKLSV